MNFEAGFESRSAGLALGRLPRGCEGDVTVRHTHPRAGESMSNARVVLPEPDADESGLILGLVEPLRAESGSIELHVHRDRSDRSLFVIYEMSRSKDDLVRHLECRTSRSSCACATHLRPVGSRPWDC
jgi:quinol monooxygenase YgiN